MNTLTIDINELLDEIKGKQECPNCGRTLISGSDVVKVVQNGLSKEDWAESSDNIQDGTTNSDHDYDYQCKGCKTGIDITWTGAVR
jgi:hypothetical protein